MLSRIPVLLGEGQINDKDLNAARHRKHHQGLLHDANRQEMSYNLPESRDISEQVLPTTLSVINEENLPPEQATSCSKSSYTNRMPPSSLPLSSHPFLSSLSSQASINKTNWSSTTPAMVTGSMGIPNAVGSLSSSLCIASTGECSYDLSSVDSGVSLPLNTPGTHPQNHLTSFAMSLESQKEFTVQQDRSSYTPLSETGLDELSMGSITTSTGGGSSITVQKMQSKIDALSLSNELMKTSLDDARKQVSTLQGTILSQREEIAAKEAQITTINGRVTALLRGMESTDSNNMQYKELYHKSVQQNGILLAQLAKYGRIGSHIQNFVNMQERVSSQLASNKDLIDSWKEEMKRREFMCLDKMKELNTLRTVHQQLIKECRELRAWNDQLCSTNEAVYKDLAKSVVVRAITGARLRIVTVEALAMKESLVKQNHDLQGKLANLLDSFNRAKEEFQENSEFSAMEREMLMESNVELEQEVTTLKKDMETGEEEFKKLVDYIKQYQEESVEKANILKENLSKADKEVEELDKLIEHTKKVLSDNLTQVKRSKPLLKLLHKLTGEDQTTK